MERAGITAGLVGEASQEVTTQRSASHIGSGTLRVYATPSMAMFVEETCRKLIDPLLPEGQTTVGVFINLRHLAPTPVGCRVHARAELAAVEGTLLTFQVRLWDDVEPVGEAEHQRAIIDVERFLKRVQAKSARGR